MTDGREEKHGSSNWRFQGKRVFLTYSQVPREWDHTRFRDRLELPVRSKAYIIGRERHRDGGVHYHIYCEYNRKIRTRDVRYFDIDGCHPNIQSVRSRTGCIAYCKKDGDYIEHGLTDRSQPAAWARAIETASDGAVECALEIIRTEMPRDWCLHGTSIERNLSSLSQPEEKVRPLADFTLPSTAARDTLAEWSHNPDRSLVLLGVTGIGKTEFARALAGPRHLWVRHRDRLRGHRGNTPIVFDDMSFAHWPRESVIHLVDVEHDSHIDIKYGCAVIKAYTPRIFTSNLDFDALFPKDSAGAIRRRCEIVDFGDTRLF